MAAFVHPKARTVGFPMLSCGSREDVFQPTQLPRLLAGYLLPGLLGLTLGTPKSAHPSLTHSSPQPVLSLRRTPGPPHEHSTCARGSWVRVASTPWLPAHDQTNRRAL